MRIGVATTIHANSTTIFAGAGEGIGTFVTHLVPALLSLPQNVELVLTAFPADLGSLVSELPTSRRLSVVPITPGEHGRFEPPDICDVWMLPSMYCHRPIGPAPWIVLIHDLVTSHLPELFDPEFAETVNHTAETLARDATFVACMSPTTRDRDLLGVLGMSAERVRMVRTAWPTDLPPLTLSEARALLPFASRRPFLLFPAKFRPHKNHGVLVEALWRLRDYYGQTPVDLVFTGGSSGEMPQGLHDRLASLDLLDRVHVTGVVSRETLSALYHYAHLTVVPTLHEQGSYPIAEALACGSPVICSDIEPLREQCVPLGSAMRYFDPRDPHAVARCIIDAGEERSSLVSHQSAQAPRMFSRTWNEVAVEWLTVLQEATATNSSAY